MHTNDECCGGNSCATKIHEHMDVVDAKGQRVGKVDRMEGESIKLTKNDSPDGQHHLIPGDWVQSVDTQVHLNKNADEVRRDWHDVPSTT